MRSSDRLDKSSKLSVNFSRMKIKYLKTPEFESYPGNLTKRLVRGVNVLLEVADVVLHSGAHQ